VTTGFAGLADFNWWLSGGLLALNTFGTHVICAAFLPHRQRSVSARVHHLAYPLMASSRVTPPNFQAEGSGPSPQPPNTSSAGKLASTSIARHVWTCPEKSVEQGQERWPEGAYAGPEGVGNGPGVDNPNLRGGTAATRRDSTVRPATGRHLGAVKPSETFPQAIGDTCPMPHGMSAHKDGGTACDERHVHESSDVKTSTCNDEAACGQPGLELCGHSTQTGREMPGSTTHVFARTAEAFATPNQLSRECKQKQSSVQPASYMPGLADTHNGGLGDESQRSPVSLATWHESSNFHVMLSGPVSVRNGRKDCGNKGRWRLLVLNRHTCQQGHRRWCLGTRKGPRRRCCNAERLLAKTPCACCDIVCDEVCFRGGHDGCCGCRATSWRGTTLSSQQNWIHLLSL
jgi:hypothetical protein